jgi:hypothetical protein
VTAVLLTSDVIEELRNRSDELGRRERLLQQDAAWDPLRAPIVRHTTGHVDYGQRRLSFSDLSGQVPAAEPALEVYIRDERPVLLHTASEESQSFLGRRQDVSREAGLQQGFLDHRLQWIFILHHQDERRRRCPSPKAGTYDFAPAFFPQNVSKSEHRRVPRPQELLGRMTRRTLTSGQRRSMGALTIFAVEDVALIRTFV